MRRFLQVKRPNQQYQSTEGKTLQRKTQKKQKNKIHIYIQQVSRAAARKPRDAASVLFR